MSRKTEKPVYLIQEPVAGGWQTFDEFTFDPAGRVHPKADPVTQAEDDIPRVKMNPVAWAQCINRSLRHGGTWRVIEKPKPKKTEAVTV